MTTFPIPPKGPNEVSMYFRQLPGLWAGRQVPVWETYTTQAGNLDDWKTEDLHLLIAECQRQLDAQMGEIERIRGRAQFVFTTSLAALALAVAVLKSLTSIPQFVVWILGIAAVVLALVGAAAIVVNSKQVRNINVHLLSQVPDNMARSLAKGYLSSIPAGANTVATQITMYRDAALLLMCGTIVTISSWTWALLATS